MLHNEQEEDPVKYERMKGINYLLDDREDEYDRDFIRVIQERCLDRARCS
jgi:hypothetical protein